MMITESESKEKPVMQPESLEEISTLVRSGFYPKKILMQMFCEERYAPGELEPNEVSSALDTEFQKLIAEQASWPDVTDCDRLDIVFAALNERGIVALQNAGYMQDDGYDEVWEAYPDAADDQGQLQLRRCSRKDFQHEVFIPTAAAAFHRDAVLERMLFQQGKRESVEPGKVLTYLDIANA